MRWQSAKLLRFFKLRGGGGGGGGGGVNCIFITYHIFVQVVIQFRYICLFKDEHTFSSVYNGVFLFRRKKDEIKWSVICII